MRGITLRTLHYEGIILHKALAFFLFQNFLMVPNMVSIWYHTKSEMPTGVWILFFGMPHHLWKDRFHLIMCFPNTLKNNLSMLVSFFLWKNLDLLIINFIVKVIPIDYQFYLVIFWVITTSYAYGLGSQIPTLRTTVI